MVNYAGLGLFSLLLLMSTFSQEKAFGQAATLPWTEDFSGSTSDWQLLKWSAAVNNPNNWHIGNAAGNNAPALYVSDNNGTSNTYSYFGGQPSNLWAIRSIEFPATSNTFTLEFDWRCLGYDVQVGAIKSAYFRVWIVPESFTPTYSQITTASGGIQIGGNFSGNENTWITESFTLPNSLAGSTHKLIFEWYNNTTNNPTPANPPAGIDNISITITTDPVTSINVFTANNVPATINTNQGTLQMEAEILPSGADQNVTWSIVPNTGMASISSTGLVTAEENGTVWAKATSVQDANFSDSLEITITNQTIPVTGINVHTENNVPATINTVQGTLQMEAEILPSTANQSVNWTIVANTGMASISSTGLVTAEEDGTVWAKAISAQNPNFSDSLEITITNQSLTVNSIEVQTENNTPAIIDVDQGTLQMVATVLPQEANQNVTWSIVPNTGAASISNTGLVTAEENGTVWAKATSVQDANFSDSLEITISNQETISIQDLNFKKSISIYPVPVENNLTISFSGEKENYHNAHIILTNSIGQILNSVKIDTDIENYQLKMEHLPAGNYTLSIINNKGEKAAYMINKL